MTTLERIRYRRRVRRIRQIRRACIISVTTLFLIITCALTVNVFSSFAQDNNSEITYKYYTSIVLSHGDTLYSLASEYTEGYDIDINNYINEVMHINHLEDASSVQSGQHLVIPYYSDELKGI